MLAPRLFGWDEPVQEKVDKFSAYCTKKMTKELKALTVADPYRRPWRIEAEFDENNHTGAIRVCQGRIGTSLFKIKILENNCGILLLHEFPYGFNNNKMAVLSGMIEILNRVASSKGRFGCMLATTSEEQENINKVLRANGFKSKSHYNQNSGNEIYVWQASLKRRRPINLT